MAKKLYYKIGEACKRLSIQPYVLRYWETEFPALKPDKSRSGQRVYTEADLTVIGRIKELLYDEGYTIAGAKKKLEAELAEQGSPKSAPAEAAPEPEKPPAAEAAAAPAKAPKRRAPAAKPAAGRKAKKPRKTGKPAAAAGVDTAAAKQVEMLRKGVRSALEQAREILALLDASS